MATEVAGCAARGEVARWVADLLYGPEVSRVLAGPGEGSRDLELSSIVDAIRADSIALDFVRRHATEPIPESQSASTEGLRRLLAILARAGHGQPAEADRFSRQPAGARYDSRTAADWLARVESAQAAFRSAKAVDGDRDGEGEFATLVELLGMAPPRVLRPAGRDDPLRSRVQAGATSFEDAPYSDSPKWRPWLEAPPGAKVDLHGRLHVEGIVIEVFLPDARSPAAWTRERLDGVDHSFTQQPPAGPKWSIGDAGGVGIDDAELLWCAYAYSKTPPSDDGALFLIGSFEPGMVFVGTPAQADWAQGRGIDPTVAFVDSLAGAPIAFGQFGTRGSTWRIWGRVAPMEPEPESPFLPPQPKERER